MKARHLLLLAGVSSALLLHGCNSSSSSSDSEPEGPFTLQLLHFADVDGDTPAAMRNAGNFSALVNAFRSEMPDSTLLLSSGDNYIPSPVYQASADESLAEFVGEPGVGRGEIAIMNAMALDVSVVGNHDLDGGPGEFAGIIASSGDWPGSAFPWLSANLDFSTDDAVADLVVDNGQEASTVHGRLTQSSVVTLDGERIGIVGATTPTLASITSTGTISIAPEDASDMDALAEVIQPAVDALLDDGIDKIILGAHMQSISVERALAERLTGVDIIVAGGSGTLLADSNDMLRSGDSAQGEYPEVYMAPDDSPVLLVNTDLDYKYLGRLVVEFDEDGQVDVDSLDPMVNGAWASTDSVVQMVGGEPIAEVVDIADALLDVLGLKDGNVAGFTKVFLEGRRDIVRSQETNLGNLTADANLWYAQLAEPEVVISIKNGGGIRSEIGRVFAPPGSTSADEVELLPPGASEFKPEGAISQLDVETALAFNNGLATVTVTAAELRDLIEHIVSSNVDGRGISNSHVGGMRFAFDPEATPRSGDDVNLAGATTGDRVRDLVVTGGFANTTNDVVVADGILQGDPDRTFRLVALDFLVSCVPDTSGQASDACGSGYPMKGLLNPERRDLAVDFEPSFDPGEFEFSATGGEQDAFAEYLGAFHGDADAAFDQAETAVEDDDRIVNLGARGNPF